MNDLPWTDTAHHGRPAAARLAASTHGWAPDATDTALDWPAREPVRWVGRPARATPRRRGVRAALTRLARGLDAAFWGPAGGHEEGGDA